MIRDQDSERVIALSFKVHGTLGAGFAEKVYENALRMELERNGLKVRQQAALSVIYEGAVVGEYFADFIVNDRLICELKACECLSKEHEVQLVNYLVATGFDIGLLINFGRSVTVRRKFRIYRPPAPRENEASSFVEISNRS